MVDTSHEELLWALSLSIVVTYMLLPKSKFTKAIEFLETWGLFFMFAGISVWAWLFFYFFMPETKGMALEEMEMLFSKNKGRKPTTETDPRQNA
ncbi:hypothetical protein D0Y65_001839 [Glycine soja]|uniref:Uncharacterized protein n=1 Tax=Glycine soja TaxID=3848 RepID=A0A445M4F9_GLYSO|nr:hypothetical protein D0Y65_001839 [Glycine soja]